MKTRVTAAALSAVLLVALAGCATPEPTEPTPTPAFATDDEAFAAAEDTYRAYVDAVNARREDPTAIPAPEDFLIGAALEAEIETENLTHEEGLSIEGHTVLAGSDGVAWSSRSGELTLMVCIDSSGTRVRDSAGADVTPPTRTTIYALAVRFDFVASEFLISSTQQASGTPC